MKFAVCLLIAYILLIGGNIDAGYGNDTYNNVIKLISSEKQNMQLMTKKDVDLGECELPKAYTGTFELDINSDGYNDYAVLLRTKKSSNKTHKLELGVFIGSVDGNYKYIELERIDDYLPSINYIKLQKPGKVRSVNSNKNIKLKNASVELVYCGKSAVVFYWNDNKFNKVWTAD